jgi:hypothetical protein
VFSFKRQLLAAVGSGSWQRQLAVAVGSGRLQRQLAVGGSNQEFKIKNS